MEGKQSVVIQGRTIHRNRPAERPDHPDSGVPVRRIAASPKDAGHESPYRLADLRDSRKRSGEERGIVRPRTHPALYGSSASSATGGKADGLLP